ncbi:MAG: hypothetical protein IJN54_04440 [Lachnospiraceae bacterium]|nr:hypothetical protein [Lachnospiraceae bacterium]
MEANEPRKEQNTEEMDVMKQFMELLGQQGMKEQSQDFMEVLQYIAGMQLQLSAMVDELQGVRKQLEKMQESQPKAAESQLLDKVSYLQEKVSSLAERLSELKDHLIGTAAQAVTVFKEKGREEMNKVLQKGISGMQSVLSGCREKMVDVLTSYEKTANQIDSIGDEFKQIGNSVANVGRLLTGKGTKEVSDEKEGVALTRVLNKPVKRHISTLKKQVERIDGAVAKLDKVCAGLDTVKEKEKEKSRVSVKEKLSQMKVKSEQQKKEPEKSKTKSQEASL